MAKKQTTGTSKKTTEAQAAAAPATTPPVNEKTVQKGDVALVACPRLFGKECRAAHVTRINQDDGTLAVRILTSIDEQDVGGKKCLRIPVIAFERLKVDGPPETDPDRLYAVVGATGVELDHYLSTRD